MIEIRGIYVEKTNQQYDIICQEGLTIIHDLDDEQKQALLEIFAGNNTNYQSCLINGQVIDNQSLKHNSYCSLDIPRMEADLTVKENFQLLCQIYQTEIKLDQKRLIKELELENLLSCYPEQLSLNDKKKISLFYAIMLQRNITVLSEILPVDDYQLKVKMAKLIAKYLNHCTTIIIIKDQFLDQYANFIGHFNQTPDKQEVSLSFSNNSNIKLLKYYLQTIKHHLISHSLMMIVSVIATSLIITGIFIIHNESYHTDMQVEILASDYFLIHNSDNDQPLAIDQLDQLKNIKNIRKLYPVYYFNNISDTTITYQDETPLDIGTVAYMTYDDSYAKMKNSVANVLLSKQLEEKLEPIYDDDYTFQLPIPILIDTDDGQEIADYSYESVNLPIGGVIEDRLAESSGSMFFDDDYIVYIPLSIYQVYLEQQENLTNCFSEYLVKLAASDFYNEFEQELNKIGLTSEGIYEEYNYATDVSLQKGISEFIIAGVSLMLVVCIIRYFTRKNDQHFFQYLNAITGKSNISLMMLGQLTKAIFLFLMIMMVFLVLNYQLNIKVEISLLSLLTIIGLTIFIEFFPLLYRLKK